MAYNTGNPVGSTDPRDLSDNAEVFDRLLNGSSEKVTSRRGVELQSLRWLEGYVDLSAAPRGPVTAGQNIRQRCPDEPANYTNTLAGGGIGNRPAPPHAGWNDAPRTTGATYRIAIPGLIARRQMVSVEANDQPITVKIYSGSYSSTDAALTSGVAWYDGYGVALDAPNDITSRVENVDISSNTAYGDTFTFGASGSGADIEAPSGARYGIPFYKVDGTTGTFFASELSVVRELDIEPPTIPVEMEKSATSPGIGIRSVIAEDPLDYSTTLADGDIENRPPFPAGTYSLVNVSRGPVYRIDAPGIVTRRQLISLYANDTSYRVFLRTGAALNSAGSHDGFFRCGVAWFDRSKNRLTTTPQTYYVEGVDLTTTTWHTEEFTFGPSGSGADVIIPSAADYCVPFFEWYDNTKGRFYASQLTVEDASSSGLPVGVRIPSEKSVSSPGFGVRSLIPDNPEDFTTSLAGGGVENRPPAPEGFGSYVRQNNVGSTYRTPIPCIIARRQMVSLYMAEGPITVHIVAGVVQGGSRDVRYKCGVAWYDRYLNRLTTTPSSFFLENIDRSMEGVWRDTFTFGVAGSGADVEAPADATYGIPYYEMTGQYEEVAFTLGMDVVGDLAGGSGAGFDVQAMPKKEGVETYPSTWLDRETPRVAPKEDPNFIGSTDSIVKPVETNLYQRYEDLRAANPGYVTRTQLGASVKGVPIWAYELTPPAFYELEPHPSYNHVTPTVVINFGIHGSEEAAVMTGLLLMTKLCKYWREEDLYANLRWRSKIVIIPCVNPDGVNEGRRANENGVDLNRNFPSLWGSGVTVPFERGYQGPEAASEPEVQAMLDLVDRYPDACAFIDCHNTSNTTRNMWVGTLNREDGELAMDVMRELLYSQVVETDDDPDNPLTPRITGVVEGGNSRHMHVSGARTAMLLEHNYSTSYTTLGPRRRFHLRVTARLIEALVEREIRRQGDINP